MGQATTPADVETADGPCHLPRHTAAGQAQTGRHSHYEVCYHPQATMPWCLQGTTDCNERKPDRTAPVINVPLIRAPPAHVWDCQQRRAPPPPPRTTPPPWGGSALE